MRRLRKWHTWLGLWTALLVLLLCVTGLLLMHKKELGLSKVMVRLPGNATAVSVEPTQLVVAGSGLVAATKQGVFVHQKEGWQRTLTLSPRILASHGGTLFAATRDGLFESTTGGLNWQRQLPGEDVRSMLTSGKDVLAASTTGMFSRSSRAGSWERIGKSFDKALDVRGILEHSGSVWLVAKEGVFQIEHGALRKEKLSMPAGANEPVELQKLITDLHNGKLGGTWLIAAIDLTALALIFLTVSGLCLWWKPRCSRR